MSLKVIRITHSPIPPTPTTPPHLPLSLYAPPPKGILVPLCPRLRAYYCPPGNDGTEGVGSIARRQRLPHYRPPRPFSLMTPCRTASGPPAPPSPANRYATPRGVVRYGCSRCGRGVAERDAGEGLARSFCACAYR